MCPVLFGSRVIFLPVLGPWVAMRLRATGLAVFLRRVLEKFFGHVSCVVFFWPLRSFAACAQAAFSIALQSVSQGQALTAHEAGKLMQLHTPPERCKENLKQTMPTPLWHTL